MATHIFARLGLLVFLAILSPAAMAERSDLPNRNDYIDLARSGWVYEPRRSQMRHDADLPPVRFNSIQAVNGEICLFGDPPHALSRQVFETFNDLLSDVFDRRLVVNYAGRLLSNCPAHQRVYIRLYSGGPPAARYNADLRQLDREFDIRFPPRWNEPIISPAQTNGFFGRHGAAAHLLIKQPSSAQLTPLQQGFYASIFIEELFQVFSFGADILKFERETPFLSKLQEHPVNLRYLPWSSEAFMKGLLQSNPSGLCGFDVFMLHVMARSGLEHSNTPKLLTFIESRFEDLRARALDTLSEPRFASVLDPECKQIPD